MDKYDWWEDFGVKIGPFDFGFQGSMRNFRYHRFQESHMVQVRINPEIKKEEIKVRLVKPELIEIE